VKILGISAFYHDSAAALIEDGKILAAAQQERYSRRKHDADFPGDAIQSCLAQAGIKASEIDYVAFYDKPFVKFERLLETYLSFAPRGFNSFRMAIPIWLKEKLFLKTLLLEELGKLDPDVEWKPRLRFSEHHLSHAASAFYPSPFNDALVLSMDGVGEWATTSVYLGSGNELTLEKEIRFPDSLGLLYSAFTYYLGFKVNSGEYKVMGLAPYGVQRFKELILDTLLTVKYDVSFHLDQDYFNYCVGLTMVNSRFSDLFGQPVRDSEGELEQFHMDIAASVQAVTEEVVLRITRSLATEYPNIKNLCLAGGVALNCVANGKIIRDGSFSNVWVQPAAGDAGGALGAALAIHHIQEGEKRELQDATMSSDAMQGSYLGPQFDTEETEKRLKACGAVYEVLPEDEMFRTTAQALNDGLAVGWFQGRMEFGPRALGARSILGDPRSPEMQKTLNLKVKYRESFRPFAPSVLREDVNNWFELDGDSPYMLVVDNVLEERRLKISEAEQKLTGLEKLNTPRSEIPAVTHVDFSARIQTVHKETNAKYHRLLSEFKSLTGCPLLVNTSFNVRGEPIVCTPEDAFHCLMGTEMDLLVVGNCVVKKQEQDPALKKDYTSEFELD
jgi:carbamoyltransferase